MSLIARLFRGVFIFFIDAGALLMLYPGICHLIRSGLIYDPMIAGLITVAVGFVGFIFVEIFIDNDVELMWTSPLQLLPLPGDEDNAI